MSNRLAFALIGAVVVAGAGAAALAGCNAVLGIDRPKLLAEAGPVADPLTCDNYCAVMAQNCQGQFNEYLLSPDGGNDVCKFVCEHFLAGLDGGDYPFFLPDGGMGEEPPSENSLGCRLWHAHAAGATGQPDVHCRHAGPLGALACGGVTADVPAQPADFAAFCGLDTTFCTLPNDDTFDYAIPVYDGGAAACEATLSAAWNADASFYVASPAQDLTAPARTSRCRPIATHRCSCWPPASTATRQTNRSLSLTQTAPPRPSCRALATGLM